jgi:SAM-dependent methyltransferase
VHRPFSFATVAAAMRSLVARADAPLSERYTAQAVSVFDADERARFLDEAGRPRHPDELPWELLYRIEPDLYARLVAGERLHEGILDWLPPACGRVLEVGAGTGRLTLDLAARCDSVAAVEPSAGLRRILEQRLRERRVENVRVLRGFFDALPAAETAHDLVISCSAFTAQALDDPRRCLEEMESRCARGGLVVLVWPSDIAWLRAHGYEHVEFEGPMLVEYACVDEAVTLARIFYPDAAEEVERRRSRLVDFTTLGMPPPRGLCWKRCG